MGGVPPGCGTLDQLYTLKTVVEGALEFAQPVHRYLMDLDKASDRVPQGVLWEALQEYGVDGLSLQAIHFVTFCFPTLIRVWIWVAGAKA